MDNFLSASNTGNSSALPEDGHRTASVAHLATLAFRTGGAEVEV